MALLELTDVVVTLPTARGPAKALRGVSLAIERGHTLGLIGESGCGKSLTALAVMGLLPEQASVTGSIRFNNQELVGQSDSTLRKIRGAKIAMIFQEPMTALNPLHTISKQIAEPLMLHKKMNRQQASAEALRLLERVQLPRAKERLNTYPHQLSGGQRQRVMIAIALACGPDLLIADEPTTALDVTIQKQVLKLISELVQEDGMGMLLISHNLGLMQDQVERILVMYAGNVVESAPTAALFKRRHHPYTQGLFESRPHMGMVRGSRLATIPGRVPELGSTINGCSFADRCNRAVASCKVEAPPLIQISPSPIAHDVRCTQWQA
jgi:peptide/nickel transport system ATP-binding protein